MARIVFGTLLFLAVVAVISGCAVTGGAKSSGKSSSIRTSRHSSRSTREVNPPILATQSGLGFLLRPRNTKVAAQKDTLVEEVFRRIDTNSNGLVDAAEWVDFSKETSVWDFVELLNYADINDDEAVSLEELFSVQIVKIDQSEEEKGDLGIESQ